MSNAMIVAAVIFAFNVGFIFGAFWGGRK